MKLFLGVVWLITATTVSLAANLPQYKVVTASDRGTYIQIGRDLARLVAPDAKIELESVPSAGSVENVTRLRYEPGVKLAIVQADVWQAYLSMAETNREAATLIRPLRVVLPLYFEEMQFIVRAGSPLNFIHEIRDAKISAGAQGSGTALSTAALYRLMFRTDMPRATTVFQSNEDALVALVEAESVDVVAIIAGQPAKLLADMKPEARKLIKFLRFDPTDVTSAAVLHTYQAASLKAASYPNLIDDDVPTLAVRALLVTYDFQLRKAGGDLVRFARSLCANFDTLRDKGHPKWKEVQLTLPELGDGWLYYEPTAREIRNCKLTPPAPKCTTEVFALGLCK